MLRTQLRSRGAVVRGRPATVARLCRWACALLLGLVSTSAASAQTPPVITTHPVEQTACVGDTVVFSVVATDADTYQWRFNGTPLTGETTDTLTLTGIVLGDAGAYDVEVSNAFGSVISNDGALSVLSGPTITTQPMSQSACAGDDIVLTVTASGSGPLSYAWTRDGTPVGTDSPSLSLNDLDAGDAGSYVVTVSSACRGVTSSTAVVSLLAPTVITTGPAAATVCEGDMVSLAVSATGEGTLNYQWFRDGTPIGTDSASLTIASATLADAGAYTVTVSATCGNVTSAPATVTVQSLTSITGQPAAQTACAGDDVTFTVSATGDAISYAWTRDGTPVGTDSATLALTGVAAADAGTYSVTVTGACGTELSSGATLTVQDPVSISASPASQTACPGDDVTFTATATGAGPLSYAWQHDGAPVGTDSPSLTLVGVSAAEAGSYSVTVTGACGSAASMTATLTVDTAPTIDTAPATQVACPGDAVTLTVAASGSGTLSYAWTQDGTPVGTDSPTLSIPSASAADAGDYVVTVTGSCGSIATSPATLTVLEAVAISTAPMSQSVCDGDAIALSVVATGSAPLSYAWTRDGTPVGTDAPTLSIPSATAADAGDYVVTITGPCDSLASSPATVTVLEAPQITTAPATQVACPGDAVTLSVVATGAGPLAYAWTRDGTPVGADSPTLSIPSASIADAGDYVVTVTGACGSVASSTATLTVLSSPVIDTQPSSQTVCTGDPVMLSVAATGAPPLSYAWTRDGSPVGTDSPTYSIPSASAADAGNYVVTVNSACGSVSSVTAVVSLLDPVAITSGPSTQSACPGDSVMLSVSATGSGPLGYAWTRDGVPVGTDSPTLTLASVSAADAGSYVVTVTGACDSTSSTPATLTVLSPPAVSAGPASQDACPGDAVSFTVSVTGSGPFSYAWTRDGSPVGTDSPVLTLASVSAADEGNYSVTISGACGSTAAGPASLSLLAPPVIIGSPSTQTACPGDSITLTVSAAGSGPLSYEWTRDGVPVGTDSPSLTLPSVTAADGGMYAATVTGACGSATSFSATLTVLQATTIDTEPVSQTACVGDAITLTVSATGSGPLDYAWTRDGSPVGTDSPTLTIASVSASDDGTYVCAVTASCGTVLSAPATLTVPVAPSIIGGLTDQTVTEGDSVLFAVSAFGTAVEYQWTFQGSPIAGATASTYSIPTVALTDAGAYGVTVSNECGTESTTATLTVQPAVPPQVEGLSCCFSDSSAQVSWNGGVLYDSIEVVRNGSLVATLPGDATSHVDPILPAGSYTYEITGVIGTLVSPTASCTATSVLSPTGLVCEVFDEGPFSYSAMLTWTNGEPYDSIQIRRDGGLVSVLAGDATTFTEVGLVLGDHDYIVRGMIDGVGCFSTAEVGCTVPTSGDVIFRRGDANQDGNIDVADVIFIIVWLFTEGPDPMCQDAADANDDGVVNVADAIFLIQYNFLDGIAPPPPFATPGLDPTTDSIGCESSIEAP